MKNKYLVSIFAFVCFVFGLTQNAAAQQGEISFANGISVAINTEQGKGNASQANIYTTSGNGDNVIHRLLIDRKSRIYFGYDLIVAPLADEKQFEVIIKKLSIKDVGPVVDKMGGLADLTERTLPAYPDKIIVRDGDTIKLDLLENPQTKEKVSDVVRISRRKQQFTTAFFDSNTPKDFSLSDLRMSLTGFEPFVNDQKLPFNGGGMSGAVMWIYFPGKGRFIFSPTEQTASGFQKVGLIDNDRITFSYDGENYKFVSNKPILCTGGKWNLWVMFDPSYKPATNIAADAPFSFGATNKVENLFEKR